MKDKAKGIVIFVGIVAVIACLALGVGISKATKDSGSGTPFATGEEFTVEFTDYLTQVGATVLGATCQNTLTDGSDIALDGTTGSYACVVALQGAAGTECVGFQVTLLPDGTIPTPDKLLYSPLTPDYCA